MLVMDADSFVEVLFDVKDGGKEIDWRKRRLVTLRLAQAYKRLELKSKHSRILNCGGYLEFRRYRDHSMRLNSANFCYIRLCPMCAWRRSRKAFAQVSRIMGSIGDEYEFVFLTLTVKNVDAEGLEGQINKLFAAFKKLCERKRFKDAVHGWVRAFETTFNWQSMEFHPHLHCILAVDKSYFTSDAYIPQQEYCQLWQYC